MIEKHKCICGEIAIYWYAPASDATFNRYFCDNCVPRGCTCNHHHVESDDQIPDLPTEEDKPFIWIEENLIWTHVDKSGREYPCVEYWYDIEGYEIEVLL